MPLFKRNLDFLQAEKVTKSGHHLFHDRASKEYGSIPGLTSQTSLLLRCMHVYKDLLRCKSVCDVKPGIDQYPLLARSWNKGWPDIIAFAACKKESRFSLKRRSAFRTGAKIYLSEKNILRLGAL